MNKYKPKTGRIPLDSVFSEYRKISEAPTIADLEAEAERYGEDIGYVIARERQNLYKTQTAFGEVFLIQNPAVWKEEKHGGMVFRLRPAPKLVIHNGEHVSDAIPSNQDTLTPQKSEPSKKIVGGFF